MEIKIVANEKGNPPGKLADAELHFSDGPLAGLRLTGFAIWERRTGGGRNVTFPARSYSVNGERSSGRRPTMPRRWLGTTGFGTPFWQPTPRQPENNQI
jgi:hypothetical protein